MPIGSVILLALDVVCFKRNNGQTMISTSHLFSSYGRSHLKNLSSWRRYFMASLFDGVTWAIIGGHVISAQGKKKPHTYHKWREKPLGWEDPISPCSPNTLYEPRVVDIFELTRLAHFIWMIARVWESLIGNNVPHVHHHSYL